MATSAGDKIAAYAVALFEVARVEGNLERVEAELYEVARVIERSDELRTQLTNLELPAELRQGIVEALLAGKAQPVTVSLVSFVVGAGRGRDLPAIIDAMVARSADERAEEIAEVRSATPLDDGQRSRLAEALSKRTGKKVSVMVTVDPQVLGGLVVTMGDNVIDGTIRHRLDQLKESL